MLLFNMGDVIVEGYWFGGVLVLMEYVWGVLIVGVVGEEK